jgi:hypothetical protein
MFCWQVLRETIGVCAYVARLRPLTGALEYIAASVEDTFVVGNVLEDGDGVTHQCHKVVFIKVLHFRVNLVPMVVCVLKLPAPLL